MSQHTPQNPALPESAGRGGPHQRLDRSALDQARGLPADVELHEFDLLLARHALTEAVIVHVRGVLDERGPHEALERLHGAVAIRLAERIAAAPRTPGRRVASEAAARRQVWARYLEDIERQARSLRGPCEPCSTVARYLWVVDAGEALREGVECDEDDPAVRAWACAGRMTRRIRG